MLTLIVGLLVTAPADARWHSRHHRHQLDLRNYRTLDLRADRNELRSYRNPDLRSNRNFNTDLRPQWSSATRSPQQDAAAVVPSDWQLQPPDPNGKGKRYVSPDGKAWFASYASPVKPESVASHMKSIAFGDDEELTYLHGEQNRILVMGRKGDRMFYRQAMTACGGTSWHHIAFEYPESAKRDMDAFIERAVKAMENSETEGCGVGLYSNQ